MLQQIPLNYLYGNSIRVSTVGLKELQKSIQENGLINPITVRDITVAGDSHPRYEVIDGFARLACCRRLKHKQVMCNIISISDLDMVEAKIIASAYHVKITRKEYGRILRTVLKANPELTIEQLSIRINQPVSKIKRWMRL